MPDRAAVSNPVRHLIPTKGARTASLARTDFDFEDSFDPRPITTDCSNRWCGQYDRELQSAAADLLRSLDQSSGSVEHPRAHADRGRSTIRPESDGRASGVQRSLLEVHQGSAREWLRQARSARNRSGKCVATDYT